MMFQIFLSSVVIPTVIITSSRASGVNANTHFKSCTDYRKGQTGLNGLYNIIDDSLGSFMVYCDFTSEPGFVYTLVMSYSLETARQMVTSQFKTKDLVQNSPVNENRPNWYAYRLSKSRMESLARESTLMRFTCSPEGNYTGHMYRDYLRAQLESVNPIKFYGFPTCKQVEYVNIRGNSCTNCRIPFYQEKDGYILHNDLIKLMACNDMHAPLGYVHAEDNFGFYDHVNKEFGCTKTLLSTTQLWFGR